MRKTKRLLELDTGRLVGLVVLVALLLSLSSCSRFSREDRIYFKEECQESFEMIVEAVTRDYEADKEDRNGELEIYLTNTTDGEIDRLGYRGHDANLTEQELMALNRIRENYYQGYSFDMIAVLPDRVVFGGENMFFVIYMREDTRPTYAYKDDGYSHYQEVYKVADHWYYMCNRKIILW